LATEFQKRVWEEIDKIPMEKQLLTKK